VATNTTAVRHLVNCFPATSITFAPDRSSYTGTFPTCSATFALNASTLPQYGVAAQAACTSDPTLSPTQQAVVFWASSGNQGAMSLCAPQLDLFYVRSSPLPRLHLLNRSQVSVKRAIASGLLTGLAVQRPWDGTSTLTGANPFNGCVRTSPRCMHMT
jgi:hypothetical protein